MPARLRTSTRAIKALRKRLDARWEKLRKRYAPIKGEVWSYSDRKGIKGQGWKIHLSATVVGAPELLAVCGPVIKRSGHVFKVAASLKEIERLNSGLYAYSQIGKLVTIYCPDPAGARALAEDLHHLTRGIPAPAVPSDLRFRPDSNVFYRYGGYDIVEVRYKGRMVPAIRDPKGKLIPDRRTQRTANPFNLPDPFVDPSEDSEPQASRSSGRKVTQSRYKADGAIVLRGSGCVYDVLDRGSRPPVRRIMKSGLRHGELHLDGMDGLARRRNELRALTTLGKAGVPVPRVVESFMQDGHAYLVLEKLKGKSLGEVLAKDKPGRKRGLHLCHQAAAVVTSIHEAGWSWGDCKLGNFFHDGKKLWALDLESAFPLGGRPRLLRATPGYYLGSRELCSGRDTQDHDLYALGVTLQRILTGTPDPEPKEDETRGAGRKTARKKREGLPLPTLHRAPPPPPPLPANLPAELRQAVEGLCNADARRRPSAAAVKTIIARAIGSRTGRAGPREKSTAARR